jgi:ABC-type uncharacterized transport system involved in gliding motility auxiliary subunit
MNRVMMSAGGLLIALVILVAVNMVAGFALRGVRADMTEHKLYTLSDASKKILGDIDEPITLRFFRSKNLSEKFLAGFAQRVEELLLEYQTKGGGKLTLEVLDPEPFSDTEDKAVSSGVQGIPLPGGEALYFGIAGSNSVGDEQVMPFVDPSKEEFLEYDLTKLVYSLAHPSKLVVGVLSPTLPIEGAMDNPMMMRQAPQPWYVMDQIRQLNYETRTIQPSATEIPKEVNVLFVVHPKNLPDSAQYAIDQFVLNGGQALVFVDPFCDADTSGEDPNNPMSRFQAQKGSGLPKLFDAWGLTLVPDKIVGDRANATPVRWNNKGREDVVNYVAWLGLGGDNVNKDEVVTSQLQRVRLATAGILEQKQGATTQFVPLLQTSDDSMEIATSQVQFIPDPPKMLADFFPSGKKMVVAARISGPAKSAFPGGKPAAPKPPEGEEPPKAEDAPQLTESKGPINVVVVADADMLSDNMWVQVVNFAGMRLGQKNADNGDFVINSLDYLHGSTDLVSLRARGSSSYPFLVVQDLQRQAEQKFRAEEQRLNEELEKAERRITELQSQKEGANAMLLSPEQVAELERLRDEKIKTRKRLREIKFESNKDIEWVGTQAKLFNIGLMPLLVLVAAIGVFVYRQNRRRAA